MSDIRVFMVCLALGFLMTFGGAHLLADLFVPAPGLALDTTLMVLGLAGWLMP